MDLFSGIQYNFLPQQNHYVNNNDLNYRDAPQEFLPQQNYYMNNSELNYRDAPREFLPQQTKSLMAVLPQTTENLMDVVKNTLKQFYINSSEIHSIMNDFNINYIDINNDTFINIEEPIIDNIAINSVYGIREIRLKIINTMNDKSNGQLSELVNTIKVIWYIMREMSLTRNSLIAEEKYYNFPTMNEMIIDNSITNQFFAAFEMFMEYNNNCIDPPDELITTICDILNMKYYGKYHELQKIINVLTSLINDIIKYMHNLDDEI